MLKDWKHIVRGLEHGARVAKRDRVNRLEAGKRTTFERQKRRVVGRSSFRKDYKRSEVIILLAIALPLCNIANYLLLRFV